ncbi:cytochrome c biogenesis protein ResB [Brevibacillus sp. B_LB10_24]|uniref:cytochrome c biogenesis protein ResB n=1 Tax=Brevibacillus sp. B_LB10_24 TaxID=3380645 RepID=UPI0038BCE086
MDQTDLDQIKCECGHANPVGTLLCESCGKPLDQPEEPDGERQTRQEFPDMRYEGMARRSQTYKKSIVDRIWNFFSSVKIAVWMIVITLIACALGTVFPQQQYIPVPVPTEADVAQFYEKTYGMLGKIYYALGFHNLFDSWWFVTLLVMIGTSLVICSLDRVIPLYKALSKPRVNPHESFLKGQKLRGEAVVTDDLDARKVLPEAAALLKKKGYRTYQEGTSLLGEKARFSRWGPYINHIGLIIFLLGTLMRSLPGMYLNEFAWIREGETVPLEGTPYYAKSVSAKVDYYSEDEFPEKLDLRGGVIAKNYQTDIILYRNENADLPGAEPKLTQLKEGIATVNHPFTYEDLSLFQSSLLPMQLRALNFTLVDQKAGNKELGKIKLDLFSPVEEQKVADGISVRVIAYFPDFYLNKEGKPDTKTGQPNNPMFALQIKNEDGTPAEKLVYVQGGTISDKADARYTLGIEKPDFYNLTGLMVRKDKMMPFIYFGSIIFLIGVVMGLYWQHRRIWVHFAGDRLYIAGHTNKNWFGLRKEVEFLTTSMNLPVQLVLDSTKPIHKKREKGESKETAKQNG